MTKQPIIFGAGLAGLIAARMLADRHPVVMERQASLPNNHHAVLRFRDSVVGDVTNIAFKKVSVHKYVLRDQSGNPLKDMATYALKATDRLHARSISDTRPVERYIAPQDLIQRLASTATIQYNQDFSEWSHNLVREHGPVISTLPAPYMMDLFGWKDKPDFNYKSGWTIKAKLDPYLECSLYGTIYSARERDEWYRASITGNELMIEGAGELQDEGEAAVIFSSVIPHFGLRLEQFIDVTSHPAKYQKISDLDTAGRESMKRFMMWLSEKHQIFSLGRFATWRPKLLLDDLVNDVRVIGRLIDGQSHYPTDL